VSPIDYLGITLSGGGGRRHHQVGEVDELGRRCQCNGGGGVGTVGDFSFVAQPRWLAPPIRAHDLWDR
jgi:hypothetical protein